MPSLRQGHTVTQPALVRRPGQPREPTVRAAAAVLPSPAGPARQRNLHDRQQGSVCAHEVGGRKGRLALRMEGAGGSVSQVLLRIDSLKAQTIKGPQWDGWSGRLAGSCAALPGQESRLEYDECCGHGVSKAACSSCRPPDWHCLLLQRSQGCTRGTMTARIDSLPAQQPSYMAITCILNVPCT